MTSEFRIEETATPRGTAVLRLHGRLDARSASALTARCGEMRSAGRSVVLNLAGVSFIASSGVGALLAMVEEFRQSPASLRLAALSPAVDSVVRLLQLHDFLQIDASEEQSATTLEAA